MDDPEGSVTRWIGNLKSGPDLEAAAQGLWRRYFDQLVRLARVRLRQTADGAADEEDVALSVLDTVYRRAAAGQFPNLQDRDELWRLLVVITARKSSNYAKREQRLKRGGGRTRNETALAADESNFAGLAQWIGSEPSPEFAAIVADEFRRLLGSLPGALYQQVVVLKLEGYTNEEVADRLGCALRTVERRLEIIRKRWASLDLP